MDTKLERVVLLKDFYGSLLTKKQNEAIRLHYENDWSLAEIAEITGGSRQAVYDLIKRSIEALENYEKRLGFADKYASNRHLINEALGLLQGGQFDDATKKELQALLRQLKNTV